MGRVMKEKKRIKKNKMNMYQMQKKLISMKEQLQAQKVQKDHNQLPNYQRNNKLNQKEAHLKLMMKIKKVKYLKISKRKEWFPI